MKNLFIKSGILIFILLFVGFVGLFSLNFLKFGGEKTCDYSVWQKAVSDRDAVIIKKQEMLMKWVEAEKNWVKADEVRHKQYDDLFIKYHNLIDKSN